MQFIRDFTNARGTRYTKSQRGVGYDKNGVWFVITKAKDGSHWKGGIADTNKGIEVKMKIIPNPGKPLSTALQAYRAVKDAYAAFILDNAEALNKFENIEVFSDVTLH